MTKRWLITGGCGFIGRNLISALASHGIDDIRVVDNFSAASAQELADYANVQVGVRNPDAPSPKGEVVDIIEADIMDEGAAALACADRDVVVHLAANTGVAPSVADPMFDCRINVIGTLNYLEGSRHAGVGRFIFASSGAPLGEVTPPLHEEIAPHPVSPYGASKLAGEGYCSAYARTFGLDTVALRFGNVYGPGSTHKSSVVAKFIRQAISGQTLEIYGAGDQTRDFIYVGELVRAIQLAALQAGIGGETFQIATAQETSVGELTNLLVQELNRRGISAPVIEHGEKRQGDVMRNFSDTTKAKERLGWTHELALEAGLGLTADWFLKRQTG